MTVERVLFVSQGISPYVAESPEAKIAKNLPLNIQGKGIDTRMFLPKSGSINDKKSFLHEVIRLSGQNIVISNNAHTLIVKVTSAPVVQMQTYFIYNEHYFDREQVLTDEAGKLFPDNDERAIFYARGIFETVRSLGWTPNIIHCHGWLSCLVPLFLKKVYAINPLFANTKVIYSVYNDHSSKMLSRRFSAKLEKSGIPPEDAELYKEINYETALKLAIDYADGVVISHTNVSNGIRAHIAKANKPFFEHKENRYGSIYQKFYNNVINK